MVLANFNNAIHSPQFFVLVDNKARVCSCVLLRLPDMKTDDCCLHSWYAFYCRRHYGWISQTWGVRSFRIRTNKNSLWHASGMKNEFYCPSLFSFIVRSYCQVKTWTQRPSRKGRSAPWVGKLPVWYSRSYVSYFNSFRLLIIGHSLGAGVATILSSLLRPNPLFRSMLLALTSCF